MVAFQQLVPPPEVATSLVALTERRGHGIAAVYRVLGLAWDPRLIAPVPPAFVLSDRT